MQCVCTYTSLAFNRFEMSIFRILAKKRDAMRISSLIEGFPDYYLDHVLLAISRLNYQRYILFSDLNTTHMRVYLNRDLIKDFTETQILRRPIYPPRE